MKRNWIRGLTIGMVIWLLIISCTLPSAASELSLSALDMTTTAMSIALTAQAGGAPAAIVQATITPTLQCFPLATANTDANIRSGPGTAYSIVGLLPSGGTASVAGQNDAHTWWFIEFAGGAGGHAWISGSVTTATCIPSALQVVAAPPLPAEAPPSVAEVPAEEAPAEEAPEEEAPPGPLVAIPDLVLPDLHPLAMPDLYVSEYSWSPVPPHMGVSFHVRIGAYNQGNAPAGAFTVQWWLSTTAPSPACTWNVASLVAHGGRILKCDYTPAGWNNAYPSQVVVDSANAVSESNESNNTSSQSLQIKP